MRFIYAVFAVAMLLATACDLLDGPAPTPRPTYTPYPTYTPIPTHTAPPPADSLSSIRARPDATLQEPALRMPEPGQHEEAVRYHSASIEAEDSAAGRVSRGRAYVHLEQCGAAITDANAALAMEPTVRNGSHTDAEANLILVHCHAYDGRLLTALQHAEAALEISIEHGYAEETVAQREALVEQLRAAIDPDSPNTEFFMGSVYTAQKQGIESFNQGDYLGAVESFEFALEHHGKPSSVIRNWLGLSFQRLGQFETSIPHFTSAIEIRDSSYSRVSRGWSYMETGRCHIAIEDAQAALSMPPFEEVGRHGWVEADWILAKCYMETGDHRSAYAHAESALNGAVAHGYSTGDIDLLTEDLAAAKSLMESQN